MNTSVTAIILMTFQCVCGGVGGGRGENCNKLNE